MFSKHYHHVLLVFGLTIMLCAILVFSRWKIAVVRSPQIERAVAVSAESKLIAEESSPAAAIWTMPDTRTQSDPWVFDLFTPPPIYRDPVTDCLTVAALPVRGRANDERKPTEQLDPSANSGAELPNTQRVQLVGYVLRDLNRPAGIFQNIVTGEICVAGPGEELAQWDAAVETVELERASVQIGEQAAIRLPVARALVRDRTTGEGYRLVSGAQSDPLIPNAAHVGIVQTSSSSL